MTMTKRELVNRVARQTKMRQNDVMEVIDLLAEKIKFNIRDLVGAFTRVASFSKIMNEKINLKLTISGSSYPIHISCRKVPQSFYI